MRQISIGKKNYRQQKIRGIKRRLNALDRWSKSYKGYFPSEYCDCRYWNCKIPVLDILVNEPNTTSKIQARCLSNMIEVANHLIDARDSNLSSAKVTVLLVYPNMFSSEICVFFDCDYFDSFFNRTSKYQSLTPLTNEQKLTIKLGIELPERYQEIGFEYRNNEDELDGISDYCEQWWSIREK